MKLSSSKLLNLQEMIFSPALHPAYNHPVKTMTRYCILASHFALYCQSQPQVLANAFDRQVYFYLKQDAFRLFSSEFDRNIWLEMSRVYRCAFYASEAWIIDNDEKLFLNFIQTEMYSAEDSTKLDIQRVISRLTEVKENYLLGSSLDEAK